ncbi:MAG: RluA family pseudouridine synthase [Chitinophagaceae bacterium]|nr:RluA family pseudouridine synthase [Oligoflexus sp.]
MDTPHLKIIFEDNHLIAVLKPARIPVASDASRDTTLLTMIRDWNLTRQIEGRKGYCVPIHFLDRPVSGVIIFALSSKAATRLNEQFRNRSLKKRYFALLEGTPKIASARLEHYLAKEKSDNRVRIVGKAHPEGKLCVLTYNVLASENGLSWVEVFPETGRSHQIRVQLASLGTPIYGDVKYGASEGWEGRIALHAATLEIQHPVLKEPLPLRAPLDAAWLNLWNAPVPAEP